MAPQGKVPITTKIYALTIISDVLGGRWRGTEEVPYYTGMPLPIIKSQLIKEQQVPEVSLPLISVQGVQLPVSPQESITTPMTTGVQSLTQSVEAPKAEAGFSFSTFLLIGLGLGAILFFKREGKHVS